MQRSIRPATDGFRCYCRRRLGVRIPLSRHERGAASSSSPSGIATLSRRSRVGYRGSVIDSSRDEIVAKLGAQLEGLAEAEMPDFARDRVRASISGLRDALIEVDDHGGDISAEAIQEIARAYMAGRFDVGGRIGGTTRRELWPRLVEAGLAY